MSEYEGSDLHGLDHDANSGADAVMETQWWLCANGNLLIWARLTLHESGAAEVFDCDGQHLRYDDENGAYAALLDAEFRALDGIDDGDAADLGIDLDATEPPQGDSDEELRSRMTQKIAGRSDYDRSDIN